MNASVLIPIYNDWEAVERLAIELDDAAAQSGHRFHLVLVDDCSTERIPSGFLNRGLRATPTITHLRLRCNVGHQRAIAVGLTWLQNRSDADAIVVMDGDGEDKPSDVSRLVTAFVATDGELAIFAERLKRSEGLAFAFFYRLYRIVHRVLTGLPVRIGNFSIIPLSVVQSLVVSNYLWYHYAAAVVRSRLQLTTIPTERGYRYSGSSKMNFVSLVRHGLSAIAVHSEVVGVRMLIACGLITVAGIVSLALCVLIKISTDLAIPGWATYASGLIVIILLQVFSITFSFTMHSLSDHHSATFLPLRDCPAFLLSCRAWHPE